MWYSVQKYEKGVNKVAISSRNITLFIVKYLKDPVQPSCSTNRFVSYKFSESVSQPLIICENICAAPLRPYG